MTDPTHIPTEAGVVASLAGEALAAQPLPGDGGVYGNDVVVLNGALVPLERYRTFPSEIQAHVHLFDVDSLAAYVMRHRGDGTTAYFDTRYALGDGGFIPSLSIVIKDDMLNRASWRRHTAKLELPHSEDWKRWTGCNRQPMDQDTFATFLEDNMLAVTDPDSADLLELVTKFEETRNVTFKSSKRLQNGERSVLYTDETARDEELRMPDTIGLALTVFEARDTADPFPLRARLRYRVQHGALSLWYELVRPDLVLKVAVDDVRTAFVEATNDEVPVLLGIRPEAR